MYNYVNGTFLGYTTLLYQPPIPTPTSYSKLKIYGGNVIIDKISILDNELDNDIIKNYSLTTPLTWTADTVFACEFNNTLDGGNIQNLPSPITNWQVYRQDVNENILKLLTTLPVSTTEYVDYSAQSNKTYTYEVFPLTDTAVGSPLISAETTTNFFNTYLMDVDSPSQVFLFDLNLSTGEEQINEDFVVYNGFTKYNAVAQGKRGYMTFNISAISAPSLCETDGEIIQTVSYLNILKDTIQNGKLKYLKNRKGEIYKGITHNFRMRPLDDAIGGKSQNNLPYVVSFDFIETEEV